MIEKSEYATKYVSGSGVLHFIHLTKNCVLAISIRGKMNTKGQGWKLYLLRYEAL